LVEKADVVRKSKRHSTLTKSNHKIERYHLHKDQPEKLQFAIYSLSDYLAKNIGRANIAHVHSFYQIIWFTKGHGKHFVYFNEFEVTPNSFFFIPKDQIHYFDDNLAYEGVIIHFNEEFIIDHENDIDMFLKYSIFNDFENELFFKTSKDSSENFLNLISQLRKEIEVQENFGHKEYLKHLLKLFLISIQRIGKRNTFKELSVNNNHHITFLKFKKLLDVNFKRKHSVGEYAEMLNISSKTLANCSKEIIDKTPLEIINERIILEAKRLISHSSLNINEIGFQLGFEDPSYFVKYFKKQTGKTPSDFRKVAS
jgi:AraC family transcriptional regulator, transcriptional activator of pobA